MGVALARETSLNFQWSEMLNAAICCLSGLFNRFVAKENCVTCYEKLVIETQLRRCWRTGDTTITNCVMNKKHKT
jgi:hypothetical protein